MSKNLNNNYSSSDSTTNLQIASLSSSISSLQTSLTSLTSSVSTTLTSYVTSDISSSTINAAITSNNTLYVLPLFTSYITTSAVTTLINTLISTFKTSFLTTINTYTANQIFTSITTNSITYIPSFNSIILGTGSIGVNCVSIGSGMSSLSCTIVGANTMLLNTGSNNTVLGSNCLNNNTSGKNLLCIGNSCASNQTTGNNNCFIGAETNTSGIYNNSCAIGYGSMISQSNQIQLGSSNETVYCNKISMPTNPILTYSTIPSTVSNQIGYQVSNSRTISAPFLSADSYLNFSLITLPIGIYIINYYFSLYSTTTTTSQLERGFIEYGISTTTTSNNIQNRKSYFSIPTGLSHVFNNSFTYVCSGNTVFFNGFLTSSELNSLTATRYYVNNANITATRIA